VRGSVFPVLFKIAPFYGTSRRAIWYISARLHNAVSQQTAAVTMNDWEHKTSQNPTLFFFANSKFFLFGKVDEWNEMTSMTCQFCAKNA
jgi:hypothetical protein